MTHWIIRDKHQMCDLDYELDRNALTQLDNYLFPFHSSIQLLLGSYLSLDRMKIDIKLKT